VRSESAALFARILSTGEQPPAKVQPRLFGGFAFRDDAADGMWAAFPAACFVLPQVLLTRHQGQVWLTLNMCLQPGSDVQYLEQRVLAELERLSALVDQPAVAERVPARAAVALQTQAQWAASVRIATAQIRAGQLQKVVLARTLGLPHPIDPLAALVHLKQHYAGTFRYLIEPQPGCTFFGATPELLVQSDGQVLRSTALAGSIRRGADAAEDAALGRELLASAKDRGEHELVVRDICSQLAPFVKTVTAAQEPNLRRLSNIQHLQTAIEGEALAGVDLLTVAAALHPTPALGGVPRAQALKLLAELEPTGRGWFGAPIGWLDANGGGLLAVAIRCAVTDGKTARLYAGAGIVADSDPEREWHETELKLRPMLDALSA
jgi:isochorismate synthase